METVEDIVRKINERAEVAARQDGDATVHHSAVAAMLRELADRIEKAAEHDYQELGTHCKRLEDAYEKLREENERLKAQLKDVGDYAAQTYDLKEALRCIARSACAALKEEDV